jgi:hypothetical protein
MHTKFWSENLKGRDEIYVYGKDLLEDLRTDDRIILKWIIRKYSGRYVLDSSGPVE